jgi:hypothetical protein
MVKPRSWLDSTSWFVDWMRTATVPDVGFSLQERQAAHLGKTRNGVGEDGEGVRLGRRMRLRSKSSVVITLRCVVVTHGRGLGDLAHSQGFISVTHPSKAAPNKHGPHLTLPANELRLQGRHAPALLR